MKAHAVFPTTIRGRPLIADMELRPAPDGGVQVIVQFYHDDRELVEVPDLTREELARLCREAAKAKSQ